MKDIYDEISSWPIISDGFGHWFSGFCDGEGSFQINQGRPIFAIDLRADDTATLLQIQASLGVGGITHRPARGKSKPQCRYSVGAVRECGLLVELFRKYPLRSRKRHDFDVWAEAVDARLAGFRTDLGRTLRDTRAFKTHAA